MVKKLIIGFLFIIVCNPYKGQDKKITVEDIWKKRTFSPAFFPGFSSMKDGKSYTQLEENGDLNKYELKSGKLIGNIVKAEELKTKPDGGLIALEDFSFSPDESKMLITTNYKPIYRRSGTAVNYVFDLKTRKLVELSDKGDQMFASFSPLGNKIAFVRQNNLFIKDLDKNEEIQVSFDGRNNSIKNGWADWVYEEEFSKADQFEWNSDGTKLAYLRFDETKVKEFEMTIFDQLYPTQYKFKYPKAGEDNSIVGVYIYDIPTNKTIKINTGNEDDVYFPRIKWTNLPGLLSIQKMNRLQNQLELIFAESDGKIKTVINETSKTYIDISDDLTFLPDNSGFIWSSEKDGFNHLYHYDMNGKEIKQITSGKWDVIEFKGYDSKTKKLFYVSTEISPTDRDVYAIQLDGKNKIRLSSQKGTNDATFSSSFDYYVSSWSDANNPPVFELKTKEGKLIKLLEDNKSLRNKAIEFGFTKKDFFTFKTTENIELYGWMMLPKDFSKTKKYPVYMFAYGGPGSNECNNQWETYDFPWHQLLCQEGYIVVCVDGRGTLGRGRDFKHSTYLQLGKYETIDQIETAKWLGNLEFVDKNRIGFQGWSFGGYLASLLITKGADYFKTAIAVAPVTNWRYYDNIYTERFMRKPQENAEGYDSNSPVNFVNKIKGKYLLIHGSADDNVHLQNSMEMSKKLVDANIPYEQFIYPNKNHGIYGGNTRLHLFQKILNFTKENL